MYFLPVLCSISSIISASKTPRTPPPSNASDRIEKNCFPSSQKHSPHPEWVTSFKVDWALYKKSSNSSVSSIDIPKTNQSADFSN
jgi:hypothetical protein